MATLIKIKPGKILAAILLFTLFWSSLMTFSETINSGYHFTDDHEIIYINKIVKDVGFINGTTNIINGDLNIRFRPFYYVHRVTLVYLFGTNYLYWSIYNVLLAIFTSLFLFLFIYRQGYNFYHAIIFPFLALMGPQTAIWWRLGPNETIGCCLLSVAIFLLVNSSYRNSKHQLAISAIFLILASLSKESFILFIPAYILLLLYLNKQYITKVSATGRRVNLILIGSLLLVLFCELYIIVFIVGTNQIQYAGIDNSFSIIGLLKFSYIHVRHNSYVYLILFGLFLILQGMTTGKINLRKNSKNLQYLFYQLAILFAIVLPQLALYNKSGIGERYLLPLNFGFSLFLIYLLKIISDNNTITSFTKKAYFLMILLVTCGFLKNDVLPAARTFQKEGIATNAFLTTIVSNTRTTDSILVVLCGYENWEWGYSIETYLKIDANRRNLKFFLNNSPDNSDAVKVNKIYSENFKHLKVNKITNQFDCIAILPFSNSQKIKHELDKNQLYQRTDYDKFTVYTKVAESALTPRSAKILQ